MLQADLKRIVITANGEKLHEELRKSIEKTFSGIEIVLQP